MDTNSTRRDLLKAGLAAASGMAIAPHDAAIAQSNSAAVVTRQRFRGWVSRGTGTNRTTLQDLTLRPIGGRQVVVRTEATNLCYSNVGCVLGIQPNLGPPSTAGPRPRSGHAATSGRGRSRPDRIRATESDGVDTGTRRRRHRRGGRPRRASRPGRRSRLRIGHAPVRRLLSVPARPRGHVSVPRPAGSRRSRADRGHERRHTGVCQLTHRRARREDGDLRGMGRPDLHEGNGRRARHGLQLRQPSQASAPRRRRTSRWSNRDRSSPSSGAGRSG